MRRIRFNRWGLAEDPVERDANARLIAAAPEMLAFLHKFILNYGAEVNVVTESARALLARIEGGK
jgi:hypothetical protein